MEERGEKKELDTRDQSLLISPGSVALCGAIDLKIAIGLRWQPLGQCLQYTPVSIGHCSTDVCIYRSN